MHSKNASVPLYRPYIPGTPVHSEKSGTLSGTKAGTLTLKALADAYLRGAKPVHLPVQKAVQEPKKCTPEKTPSGTLLSGIEEPKLEDGSESFFADHAQEKMLVTKADLYTSKCSGYWRECHTCPDHLKGELYFCARHSGAVLLEWSKERLQ